MKNKSGTFTKVLAVMLAIPMIFGGCSKASSQNETNTPVNTPADSGKFVPDRPITMMVPFSAGGGSDLLARAVEKVWSKYCPQTILVVNKPGAAGIEGSNQVAKSKPDGYTLLMGYGSGNDTVNPHLQSTPHDPLNDLVSVSTLTIHSIVILVPQNSPFKSLSEVLEWSKKENKPITAAVSTAGGAADIVIKALAKHTGANMTSVPHSGGNLALTSLVSGQTVIGTAVPSEAQSMIKSGKAVPIAISTAERDPVLKDVPTIKEQGIDFSSWGSLKQVAVPKGTSKEIIDYYDDIFKKISEDDEFKETMEGLMQPVIYKGSEESSKLFKEVYEDYGKLIKDLGITLQ